MKLDTLDKICKFLEKLDKFLNLLFTFLPEVGIIICFIVPACRAIPFVEKLAGPKIALTYLSFVFVISIIAFNASYIAKMTYSDFKEKEEQEKNKSSAPVSDKNFDKYNLIETRLIKMMDRLKKVEDGINVIDYKISKDPNYKAYKSTSEFVQEEICDKCTIKYHDGACKACKFWHFRIDSELENSDKD